MTRLLLLPGFGEDGFCFNELIPLFDNKHDLVQIDYRPVLDKFTFPFITCKEFSKQLIKFYNITKEDKLIGHSMGGYFSFQIREFIRCEICMISAFHDPGKVIHLFPKFPRVTLLAAMSGLIKTDFLKQYLLSKIQNEKYKAVQVAVMDNFKTFTNAQLGLMIEMDFDKKIVTKLPNPLRIHDAADRIIAPPDEPHHQVGGGHFCLNLYPQETFNCMKEFLA